MTKLIAQIDFGGLSNKMPGLRDMFKPGAAPGSTAAKVSPIFNELIKYIFVVAGLLLLIYLIYGGFHMILAANNEKGLQEARGKITNALMGFLLLFISFWIVQILQAVLGVNLLK